ncbi:type II secretion system protein N [Rhodoferax sp.]|uniref:type II secretion system protein N n=1 Tax=Rhodoferax sp. TaxID=50421 RepID=UPI0026159BA6|nr:type II secretion system protein N [Rhodoferax sp.]MDD2924311.1 type II secretion system protein N [Rhodoferax sp.]
MLRTPPESGPNRWLTRLLTLFLSALATASAVFWVLHWPAQPQPARNPVSATPVASIDSTKIAQLLGASQSTEPNATPSLQSHYKLLGVIAQGGQGTQGRALLAAQGAAAKPYRVGDPVGDGLVLQAVKARSVVLGPPGQTQGTVTLTLPILPGMPETP